MKLKTETEKELKIKIGKGYEQAICRGRNLNSQKINQQ